MWSLTGGFSIPRSCADGTADPKGSSVGSELQIGAAIAYADTVRRFAIGPEVLLGTTLLGNETVSPAVCGLHQRRAFAGNSLQHRARGQHFPGVADLDFAHAGTPDGAVCPLGVCTVAEGSARGSRQRWDS